MDPECVIRSGAYTPVRHDRAHGQAPESTKTSLGQRLTAHARQRWPQFAGIDVRYRGAFAYIDGQLPRRHHPAPLPAPLRRLGQHMGICHLPRQQRQLPGLRPAHRLARRHPQEALDCAAGLYLADSTAWLTLPPPTN
jgi:hypothetical protein